MRIILIILFIVLIKQTFNLLCYALKIKLFFFVNPNIIYSLMSKSLFHVKVYTTVAIWFDKQIFQ
jgi:hypothetical protein